MKKTTEARKEFEDAEDMQLGIGKEGKRGGGGVNPTKSISP